MSIKAAFYERLTDDEQKYFQTANLDDYEIPIDEFEISHNVKLLNVFQQWYNKEIQPDWCSMIEDEDNDDYANDSLDAFYGFLMEFKDNLGNLEMTKTFENDDIQYSPLYGNTDEIYCLTYKTEKYYSFLLIPLLMLLLKKKWMTESWSIVVENTDTTGEIDPHQLSTSK